MGAAVKAATAAYNKENEGKVVIELEEAPDGWETKALAMIRDKNLRWAAHPNGRFDYQFRYIKTGMVQPLDPLLRSSGRAWTKNLKAQHYAQQVAVGLAFHSWIRSGKQIWGDAAVAGALPPRLNKSDPPRSWIHTDSSLVFANSSNAELGADWIFGMVGPEGEPSETFFRGILTQSGMPPYTTMYEKVVKGNKAIPEIYQVVPNSTIAPIRQAGIMPIVQAQIWPHLEQSFARKEIAAELAKNKSLFG